jgi:hypothetical protein
MNAVIDDSLALKPVASEEVMRVSFEARSPQVRSPDDRRRDRRAAGCAHRPRPKSLYALLTNRILGLGDSTGLPSSRRRTSGQDDASARAVAAEDISFPPSTPELVKQDWDSSDLKSVLEAASYHLPAGPRGRSDAGRDTVLDDAQQGYRHLRTRVFGRRSLDSEDRASTFREERCPAVHVRPHGATPVT